MAGLITSSQDKRDTTGYEGEFVVTDHTQDFTLDCDTDNANAIADVLGQLIQVLINKGVIQGSVTDH